MAPITRVNSVAVSIAPLLTAGMRLHQDDFVSMLVDCGFEPEHIFGIQHLPHRRIVIVKFRTEDHYTRFLELETVKINNIACKLFDLSSNRTQISVLGAPFEMDKQDLLALLERYGRVHSIRQRTLGCATHSRFNILPDGTWIVYMDLIEHIPSYLMVGDVRLALLYNGQPKTCRLCNSNSHLARDCKAPIPTKVFSDPHAFPPLEIPASSKTSIQQCVQESRAPDAVTREAPGVPTMDTSTHTQQEPLPSELANRTCPDDPDSHTTSDANETPPENSTDEDDTSCVTEEPPPDDADYNSQSEESDAHVTNEPPPVKDWATAVENCSVPTPVVAPVQSAKSRAPTPIITIRSANSVLSTTATSTRAVNTQQSDLGPNGAAELDDNNLAQMHLRPIRGRQQPGPDAAPLPEGRYVRTGRPRRRLEWD